VVLDRDRLEISMEMGLVYIPSLAETALVSRPTGPLWCVPTIWSKEGPERKDNLSPRLPMRLRARNFPDSVRLPIKGDMVVAVRRFKIAVPSALALGRSAVKILIVEDLPRERSGAELWCPEESDCDVELTCKQAESGLFKSACIPKVLAEADDPGATELLPWPEPRCMVEATNCTYPTLALVR